MLQVINLLTSWLPFHVHVIVYSVFVIFIGFALFRLIAYLLDLIPFV